MRTESKGVFAMTPVTCCLCHKPVRPNATECPACGVVLLVNSMYRLNRMVGQGGFGMVFDATNIQSGSRRAVKRIRFRSPAEYEQILVEISINKDFEFPFVPKYYGAWAYGSNIYMVTAFAEGSSLDNFPQELWTPARIKRFLKILLGYLATMHDAGVVHRDLSPKNIMRTPENEYVLLDFGIAKDQTSTLSLMRGAGNPAYASPEQALGKSTTRRSDLYCLGATAYQLLTGDIPSASERLNGMSLLSPQNVVTGVSPALNAALQAMLELDHDNRPTSARAVLRLMDSYELPARSAQTSSSIPAGCFIGAIAIAGVIVALWFMGQFSNSDDPKTAFVGRVAYSSQRNGDYDLFIADSLFETPQPVTDSIGDEFAPVWSPDQSKLAFVSITQGIEDICVLDMDTKTINNLTNSPASDGTPAWSPDGTRIAFISWVNSNYELFVINSDGTALQQLTTNVGIDRSPVFIDQHRILYISEHVGNYGLYLLDTISREFTVVLIAGGEKRIPSLSPDNKTVVFSMIADNNWDIYTFPVDGGEPMRLTDDPAEDSYPAWSADGKTIVFMSTRDQAVDAAPYASKLYVMQADGENEMRVFDETTDDRHPAVTRPTAMATVTATVTLPENDN